MKILFVSAILPYPLHSGGQIRIYNLLKRLSKRHEITLVSYIRDPKEHALLPALGFCKAVHMIHRGYAWQVRYLFRTLVSSYPFLMATYDNADMRSLLARLLAETRYSLIHVEPFYVWSSLPHTNVPIVVSEHNIEYAVYGQYANTYRWRFLRPLLRYDVKKLMSWERKVWRNAAALTAVSEDDAQHMESYLSRDVSLVPNGVDLSLFRYQTPRTPSLHRAVFVGNFLWLPNRQAAHRLLHTVWPEITKKYPDAHLTVVGRHIPDALAKTCRAMGVEVKSDVPDILPIYHDADVLLAPHSIAGGTKYKMLEAMASGLPVVTSSAGMAGLAVEPGVQYLEAARPHEYVSAVEKLWERSAYAVSIAQEARHVVETLYGWNTIASRLDRVWKASI